MKWIPIDDYGKYIVVRKEQITKADFFLALRCKETSGFSVQNVLYSVLCENGVKLEPIFEQYSKNYDGDETDFIGFLSNYFKIDSKNLSFVFDNKREGECCFFVDTVLIDGYSLSHLLNPSYDDEDTKQFIKKLKEALKEL